MSNTILHHYFHPHACTILTVVAFGFTDGRGIVGLEEIKNCVVNDTRVLLTGNSNTSASHHRGLVYIPWEGSCVVLPLSS